MPRADSSRQKAANKDFASRIQASSNKWSDSRVVFGDISCENTIYFWRSVLSPARWRRVVLPGLAPDYEFGEFFLQSCYWKKKLTAVLCSWNKTLKSTIYKAQLGIVKSDIGNSTYFVWFIMLMYRI